ncbi:MAG: hypothetical protein OET44_12675 [Gammaproteobacteria bacterium]|nr:hypothetical protein [Gammaproteobacteria bacterium]
MTVTDCANALETSEYEIFCRAYTSWYGRVLDRKTVERDFGRYLIYAKELPCYVRAFLSRTNVLAA